MEQHSLLEPTASVSLYSFLHLSCLLLFKWNSTTHQCIYILLSLLVDICQGTGARFWLLAELLESNILMFGRRTRRKSCDAWQKIAISKQQTFGLGHWEREREHCYGNGIMKWFTLKPGYWVSIVLYLCKKVKRAKNCSYTRPWREHGDLSRWDMEKASRCPRSRVRRGQVVAPMAENGESKSLPQSCCIKHCSLCMALREWSIVPHAGRCESKTLPLWQGIEWVKHCQGCWESRALLPWLGIDQASKALPLWLAIERAKHSQEQGVGRAEHCPYGHA